MKYQISECILEVTRRCNMCCDHCLRGDAQNSDLDLAHVKKLFSHIDSIDTLTLTGGEPSLVPEIIHGIADAARENNVNIERFYMVTNGKKVTDDFIKAVLNLYLYCQNIDDDFSSRLDVSNDGHHEEIEPENLKKLMAFRFTGKKTNDDGARFDNGQFTAIINQGRGAELWNRELKLSGFEFYETAINETTFYMNVNGDILGDCNLSYESQDALKVANVNDKGFSPMKAAEKWNKIIDAVENTAVENVIESISAVV